tara:strand:+ start:821 stop:1249 length:429 start_codon:yes stop_codon:yes gene_type:complete
MSFLNFNDSPLIAIYNATSTTPPTGGEYTLRLDTSLHSNTTIAANNTDCDFKVSCFLTADLALEASIAFGGSLKMLKNGNEIDPRGSCASGTIPLGSTGCTNEVIADNVNSNTVVKLVFKRGDLVASEQTFQDFSRLIGVVT